MLNVVARRSVGEPGIDRVAPFVCSFFGKQFGQTHYSVSTLFPIEEDAAYMDSVDPRRVVLNLGMGEIGPFVSSSSKDSFFDEVFLDGYFGEPRCDGPQRAEASREGEPKGTIGKGCPNQNR